jgi:hypothetical protein
MLPGLRFVIGAVLATAMLAVVSVGLFKTVKLEPQTSRSLGFHERADWNQFYDPEALRRFEELAGKSDAAGLVAKPSADELREVTQPVVPASGTPPAADAAAETGTAGTSPGEAASETPVTAPSSESASETTATLAPAPTADNTPVWQDEPLFIVDDTTEAASAADHSATPPAADNGAEKPPTTEAP